MNNIKVYRSPTYNFSFRTSDGLFMRWGKTYDDDPQIAPSPELADIELSTGGCPTINGKNCAYCYKANTSRPGKNMTLEEFKVLLPQLGKNLCQIAFGLTGIQSNPDLIPILRHTREQGIVPNFTLSGADLTDELVEQFAPLVGCSLSTRSEEWNLVGAVAVSFHGDASLCFHTVERLCRAGIRQVNIHCVTDNYFRVLNLMRDILIERDASEDFKLNALVLLSLKPKGRATKMTNISEQELGDLIHYAQVFDIPLGFDSCSAHRVMKFYPPEFQAMIEPCESALFSLYSDVNGKIHPCSFAEGLWGEGLDAEGAWEHPRMVAWREKLLANDRQCPLF